MTLQKILTKIIIKFLRFYQAAISPDHSVFAFSTLKGCRYYPTCSEYAVRALERYGLWRGFIYALWRVLRCNPFSRGGVDEK